MKHAVQRRSDLADLPREARNLLFALHVADEDRHVSDEFPDALAPRLAANRVDQVGAKFGEQLTDVPGHAFAIRDTQDQDGLAGQLQKIAHVAASLLATIMHANSSRAATFPLQL